MKYFLRSFSPLRWFKKGSLSISGEKMCTILVNRLDDKSCVVKVWLGKLTALDMTPLGWLGRKTSTQTKKTFASDVSLFLKLNFSKGIDLSSSCMKKKKKRTYKLILFSVSLLSNKISKPQKAKAEVSMIIQSNFNGSNIFGTMEICSRHG